MKAKFAGLGVLVVGCALGLSSLAQDNDQNQGNNNAGADRGAGQTQVIRGFIAGITVEGETAIDYKSNRAVTVEASCLTIVGSQRQGNTSDANASAPASKDESDQDITKPLRRRQNIYVIWLTPRTKIRDARSRDRDQGKAQGSEVSFDALEVGDRVQVRYTLRDEGTSPEEANAKGPTRTHGRSRTYFGDAVSITLLPEPVQRQAANEARDRNREGGENQDQGKDQNQTKDQDKGSADRDND